MEEFRNALLQLITSVELPPEAVYYILKDVYREIDDSYKAYLKEVEKSKAQ